MRLRAQAGSADGGWVASLDGLGFTGEDVQIGIHGLGLPSENVIFDSTDFLLREGLGRDWAGQSGGGS